MSNEEIVQLIQAGTDVQCNYERLYRQNKGYIYSIAKKYAAYEDIEDLMQEAYFGLVAAAQNYKPGEVMFLSYAAYWIKQAIARYVHRNGAVSMGIDTRAKLIRYKKLCDQYISQHGEKPSQEHMAAIMGTSIECVQELELCCYRCSISSTDAPCGEDGECTVGDLLTGIEGIEDNVVNDLFRQQVYSELWEKVENLEAEQAAVIRERYQHDRTQEQTGEVLGINREQVRQLHNKAMRKLRSVCRRGAVGQYADEYIYSAAIRNYNFHTTWTSSTEHVALQRLDGYY